MQNKTTEFSFILKPSEFGVGVFTVEDIQKDTHLRLFGDREVTDLHLLMRKKESVPELFRGYCVDRNEELACPSNFGHMHIGWYLNHSDSPNAYPDNNYEYYAFRDIKAGEEITINYNVLNEPEENKEEYYKQS